MDLTPFIKRENEQPLENIVANGGLCGIFRTIACIGDSLSSGEHESRKDGEPGYHDYYEYSWGQFMARDAGLTVYNFSKGGLATHTFLAEAPARGWFDEEKKARAYIIALGVNDFAYIERDHVMEFGSVKDIDPENEANNKPTFAGYYGAIITKYRKLQPKAKFFLVTCPHDEPDTWRPAFQTWCDKHQALLYEIAALFEGCYVIDLRRYGPVYDGEFRRNFYLGGHLNAAGYRLTALMMESYIDYIIRHNPEDFKQIGFVGTPYHHENEKW